jgi:hypothetical protein
MYSKSEFQTMIRAYKIKFDSDHHCSIRRGFPMYRIRKKNLHEPALSSIVAPTSTAQPTSAGYRPPRRRPILQHVVELHVTLHRPDPERMRTWCAGRRRRQAHPQPTTPPHRPFSGVSTSSRAHAVRSMPVAAFKRARHRPPSSSRTHAVRSMEDAPSPSPPNKTQAQLVMNKKTAYMLLDLKSSHDKSKGC